ncbi:MAG TPA: ATP-dependent helicase HrpB [Rhodanobacteraceae bacterium]|nr:ATP-dependent helicase HrpB [Rhodanobacteraceae bacterium]
MRPDSFPIHALLPDLRRTLDGCTRLVLEAPPGAGKTTQVPPALLDAHWLGGKKILLLEPRRLAARAAAEFMASAFGDAVGATVGYRIRFENRVSAATRIEVVTEGILTRMLQDQPELPGVGAILFDEFHERHLHGDLGAALARDVQASLRPDLRLVVMSATLDGARIARWFDAERLSSGGRGFPVRIVHPPARASEDAMFVLRRAVEQALAESEGDVLVFLPGRREIERARRLLGELTRAGRERAGDAATVTLVPLHGELSLAEQHAALAPAPPGSRRVVLATNIAESSLTLPGVRAVVDGGLARVPRFDPPSGFTRLETVAISQASADQRAGRAGRLGPGVCYRLWPQSRRLEASAPPEIAQVELSQLALELAVWGADTLDWLDAPPAGALAQARDLLVALGAMDGDHRPTPLGRDMLRLGAHPRLAAAVLRAPHARQALACDLAALVEARNPLRGDAGRTDDFRVRLAALHAWRARSTRDGAVDERTLAAIAQAADGWRRRLPRTTENGDRDTAGGGEATNAGDILLHAFPDRIARQDPDNPRRYRLANGRGARLGDDSALIGEPWLVVVDLRFDPRDSLVFAAAPFDPATLECDFPDRFETRRVVAWNAASRRVEAFEERRFDAIVLERRPVPPRPEDALQGLLAAVRDAGLDALPWSADARDLRARTQVLREWCPELGLPDVSDAALLVDLDDWLAPVLAGKTRLDALRPAELSDALARRFERAARRALDEHAPATLRVPSGQSRRIAYAPGAPPVLAVKLQELFGLADTPRIARGRVAVSLHLLSPAGRPIQVTSDLRSFWERTYPEVRRELKGRYPKHPWPEDPWSAMPTHRAKPRR